MTRFYGARCSSCGRNCTCGPCPLCGHPRKSHPDGIARQELNTMGCASCTGCEAQRQALDEAKHRAAMDALRRAGEKALREQLVKEGVLFCNVTGCENEAVGGEIGEVGDLLLCAEHLRGAEQP